MQYLVTIGLIVVSYLLGAIPFGLVLVRIITGQDVRQFGSGRTGGTNAMRAAGFWVGLATGILDALKSAATVWLARYLISINLIPDSAWLEILPPILAVLGHNYSIFLADRDPNGRLRLHGGAGGASAGGGVLGLWPPAFIIILIIAMLLLFGLGYASVATLSVGILAAIIFAISAWLGYTPWQFIFYGIIVEIILVWALRPNIGRLINGTERVVGWRARRMKTN